jgi:hypothetical protein
MQPIATLASFLWIENDELLLEQFPLSTLIAAGEETQPDLT